MRKKVTIDLEIEAEFESAVYAGLGDLLADIEDSNFEVLNVKVDDIKPALNIPTLRNVDVEREVNNAIKRTHDRSSW
jgi:hypothetical protein